MKVHSIMIVHNTKRDRRSRTTRDFTTAIGNQRLIRLTRAKAQANDKPTGGELVNFPDIHVTDLCYGTARQSEKSIRKNNSD